MDIYIYILYGYIVWISLICVLLMGICNYKPFITGGAPPCMEMDMDMDKYIIMGIRMDIWI